jgi:hypothetical protein
MCCIGVSSFKEFLPSGSANRISTHRALELIGLNLTNLTRFGSAVYSSNAYKVLETRRNTTLRADPQLWRTVLHMIAHSSSEAENHRLQYGIGLVLLATFLLVFILMWHDSGGSTEASDPTPRTITELETSMGIWACKYRDSTKKEKESIELLLKCNIISQEDLADTQVSQDHIVECITLADRMLAMMSSADWLWLKKNDPNKFKALSEGEMDAFLRGAPTPRIIGFAAHTQGIRREFTPDKREPKKREFTPDTDRSTPRQRVLSEGSLPVQTHGIRPEFAPRFEEPTSADATSNASAATFSVPTRRRMLRPSPHEMDDQISPVPMLDCSTDDLFEYPTTNSSLSTASHGEKEHDKFSTIMAARQKELSKTAAQTAWEGGSTCSGSPFLHFRSSPR